MSTKYLTVQDYVYKDSRYFLYRVHEILKRMIKNQDEDGNYKFVDSYGNQQTIILDQHIEKFKPLFAELKLGEIMEIRFSQCVDFMEDMNMEYSIRNFDIKTSKFMRLSSRYFLHKMSKPIAFINNLYSTKYYKDEFNLINCSALSDIYNFVIDYESYDIDKEKYSLEQKYIDCITNVIKVIAQKNVKDGKYCVTNVYEYRIITNLIKKFEKHAEINDCFYKSIVKYIEPYLLEI